MDKLLEINNLKVEYKTDIETVYAVNGISFSLEKGKTLGLVGETGAGKSTTALTIMRLLPEKTGKITSGSVVFDGTNILDTSEETMRSIRGEEIAMIFQDPMTSLNPVQTVGEQVFEALRFHNRENKSLKELEERVDEVFLMVGIDPKRKNEYPHQFSGGMKQRVVIAMALVCEPRLLISDEPTTALDVTIQAQVLAMMEELKKKFNMSMIMITHDLGIVAKTCDDVAVMYAGEIVEYGSVEEIFSQGQHHPYTEGLFGSIPKLNDTSMRLKPIDGMMLDPTLEVKGCRFASRCPYHKEICDSTHPDAVNIDGRHTICCHLYKKGGMRNE